MDKADLAVLVPELNGYAREPAKSALSMAPRAGDPGQLPFFIAFVEITLGLDLSQGKLPEIEVQFGKQLKRVTSERGG
jgi:hypothetical protein